MDKDKGNSAMDSKFTVVFFRMALNGPLAGKEIQTDDSDFFECFNGYSRTDDFCVVWQHPNKWDADKIIAGKWFAGH